MRNPFLTIFLVLCLGITNLAAMGNDDPLYSQVAVEDFEYQIADEKALSWDANVWVGYSLSKVYIYSEGEKVEGSGVESENQLLYSRAIAPYWDVQVGLAYDATSESDYTWGVVALNGMSAYFFEIRAVLLVGKDENIGLRFEADYEALLTQKLILTPSFSTALYSKDVDAMELGKGLSNTTLGLRLKYEIKREFAPYIGVEWSKNYENTADFHPLDDVYGVVGVNFWY